MEEIQVHQQIEQFSTFIQFLNDQKSELRSVLDFQMGTSSSFENFISTFKERIIPYIESMTQKYVHMYQENVRISFQQQDEMRKSVVYEKAYSEVHTYLTQIRAQYNQIWTITAAFASLLLQSDTENANMRNQLAVTMERSFKMKHIIENLQNKLFTMEKREKWIENNLGSLLTAPNMLINAQKAVNCLQNTLHDEREIKIQQYEGEIQNLNSRIEEYNNEIQSITETHKNEVEELKSVIENLNEKFENQEKEREKMKEELNELTEQNRSLKHNVHQKEVQDLAINEFCKQFPFIQFNGTSFDYQTVDGSTQQIVLETTLESLRKENKTLTNQLNDLKRRMEQKDRNYESELKNERSSANYEIEALKLELKQCVESRDEAISESRRLRLQIKQVENDRKRAEENVKKISELNQELKTKYIELKYRESQSLATYEEKLAGLTGIEVDTMMNVPSLSIPTTMSAIAAAENIGDSVIKEANETLQKENRMLANEKKELESKFNGILNENNLQKLLIKELKGKLNDAQNDIQHKEETVGEWKQRHDSLLQNVKSTNPLSNEKASKIDELEGLLNESNETTDLLKKELDETTIKMEKTIREYEKETNKTNNEISTLKEQLSSVQEELSDIQNKNSELVQKIETLEISKSALLEATGLTPHQEGDKSEELIEKNKRIEELEEKLEKFKKSFQNFKAIQQEKHNIEINTLNDQIVSLKQMVDVSPQDNNNKNIVPEEQQIKFLPPPEYDEPDFRERREIIDEEKENREVDEGNNNVFLSASIENEEQHQSQQTNENDDNDENENNNVNAKTEPVETEHEQPEVNAEDLHNNNNNNINNDSKEQQAVAFEEPPQPQNTSSIVHNLPQRAPSTPIPSTIKKQKDNNSSSYYQPSGSRDGRKSPQDSKGSKLKGNKNFQKPKVSQRSNDRNRNPKKQTRR